MFSRLLVLNGNLYFRRKDFRRWCFISHAANLKQKIFIAEISEGFPFLLKYKGVKIFCEKKIAGFWFASIAN